MQVGEHFLRVAVRGLQLGRIGIEVQGMAALAVLLEIDALHEGAVGPGLVAPVAFEDASTVDAGHIGLQVADVIVAQDGGIAQAGLLVTKGGMLSGEGVKRDRHMGRGARGDEAAHSVPEIAGGRAGGGNFRGGEFQFKAGFEAREILVAIGALAARWQLHGRRAFVLAMAGRTRTGVDEADFVIDVLQAERG